MPHAKEIIALLVLSNGAMFAGMTTCFILWIRARERAIRASLEPKRHVERGSADIEQLMNAVDAIAVEVERISEAQRFTTKVLVERVDAGAAKRLSGSPERVITPH